MIKDKNRFNDEMVLHPMCKCGRGRATFGEEEDGAHCIHCAHERTSRTKKRQHSRATFGLCYGCRRRMALYDTVDGKRCHWCRRNLQGNGSGVASDKEIEQEEVDQEPPKEEVKCDYCGSTFERKESHMRSARKKGQMNFYCDQNCFYKSRRLSTPG